MNDEEHSSIKLSVSIVVSLYRGYLLYTYYCYTNNIPNPGCILDPTNGIGNLLLLRLR